MRGDDQQLQTGMFSYVALEDRIPADHPLRGVRALVDAVLAEMSKDFDGLYSEVGRPQLHPSGYCGRCCCRYFIRCAVSGC
jgi:transposase